MPVSSNCLHPLETARSQQKDSDSIYEGECDDSGKSGFGIYYLNNDKFFLDSEIGKIQGPDTIVGMWRNNKIYKRFYNCKTQNECTQKENDEINKQKKEQTRFNALLKSKSPQTMYIEAGKYERNGSPDKANELYNALIERFPDNSFAVKASDKLTDAKRSESEVSQRRSQSIQDCENSRQVCMAGCEGISWQYSGSERYSCEQKCKSISCY